jgi:hypothetical protein
MSFKRKCQVLITLFCLESLVHLVDGAAAFFNGAHFGQYGNGFATAAIFAFLAYAIYSSRNKWTYWLTVFFAALVLIRFVMGISLMSASGSSMPLDLLVLGAVNSVLFGIIPLALLLPKTFRVPFIKQQEALSL